MDIYLTQGDESSYTWNLTSLHHHREDITANQFCEEFLCNLSKLAGLTKTRRRSLLGDMSLIAAQTSSNYWITDISIFEFSRFYVIDIFPQMKK